MHSHSWRVLVAGRLHLDSHLRGLALAEDAHHQIIRDATLSAFEQLIESAIEKSVDLLLITGTLCDQSPTLRACTIFRDGIEALIEEGIAVAWATSDRLEIETLQQLSCLPESLVLLNERSDQQRFELSATNSASNSSSTDRLDSICCEMISSHSRFDRNSRRSSGDIFLQIGITHEAIGELSLEQSSPNVNDEKYQLIISSEAERRHTTRHGNTLYHAPGALQGLTNQTIGLCSASLIEIDSQGSTELYRVRTAAVIREQLELTVQENDSLEDVLERVERELVERLSDYDIGPARLLHFSWEIRGPHTAITQLSSAELQEYISSLQPLDETSIIHEVILAPQLTGAGTTSHEFNEEQLGEQFLRLLGEQNVNKEVWSLTGLQKSFGKNSIPIEKIQAELSSNDLCHRAAEFGLLALQEKLLDAG